MRMVGLEVAVAEVTESMLGFDSDWEKWWIQVEDFQALDIVRTTSCMLCPYLLHFQVSVSSSCTDSLLPSGYSELLLRIIRTAELILTARADAGCKS